MGFHRVSATRNMRTPHAHLDRRENGDIYAVYKLGFKKDSPRFEYCFIGEKFNVLTYNDEVIERHPKFKEIGSFEDWCRGYAAEHD